MISTVTTATIVTISASGLTAPLALIAILVLLALLVQREVASAGSDPGSVAHGRALTVAIGPLLLGFAFIAAVDLAQLFR